MTDDEARMEILGQVERGQISVEEALCLLERRGEGPTGEVKSASVRHRRETWWWLVPFGAGLGVTAAGGWMLSHGGWWWLGGLPTLLVGIPLLVVGAASRDSPWVQIQVRSRRRRGRRQFSLNLPIPIRPIAWVLGWAGRWVPGLEDTVLDELIVALDENVGGETPLVVEVNDEEDGEQVRVIMG